MEKFLRMFFMREIKNDGISTVVRKTSESSVNKVLRNWDNVEDRGHYYNMLFNGRNPQ